MEYVCKIGMPSGEVVERTFVAPDEKSLRTELEQKGYYLFSVRRGFVLKEMGFGRDRVPTELLLIFCQELAALLKAGLPLVQSLEVMLERQRHPVFRRSLEAVRDRVKSGTALSEAFQSERDLYPAMLSASLVAGERSGNLEGVLRRLAQYLRLNLSLKKKAISASVYPLMLFAMMGVLVGILVLVVIPKFEDFYKDFNVDLPFITRALMSFSTVAARNAVWILLVLVALVMGAMSWLRREGSGVTVDRVLFRVPYLGPLTRMYATSQLARTLSALLSGGLPLVNAMDVAAASVGNRAMAAAVAAATPQIREGRSLTVALESTQVLDNLALEMVKVGEQTGALGDMLNAVADFYDEEIENRMAAVLALIEPIMLVCMAVIVAGMLLAFYLPLFEAISAIQR
jgi:type IV pilus assembly protein PilC